MNCHTPLFRPCAGFMLLWTSLLCGLACGVTQRSAWAQDSRVFTYAADALPPALTLKRGDVLHIEGTGLHSGEAQMFLLRAGDQIRAQTSGTGRWRLRYDTRLEHFPACILTVWQQVNGGMRLRARTRLRLVSEAPLQIASPAPNARLTEATALHVRQIGSDKAERIGYTLDGKPLGVFAEGDKDTVWNPKGVAAGRHLLGAIARLEDGSLYPLDVVPIVFAAKLRVLPFAVGETLDLGMLNGSVPIRADMDPTLQPRVVTYLVDGKPAGQRHDAPFDQLAWNPRSAKEGGHALVIDMETQTGPHLISAPYSFVVRGKSDKRATSEAPFVPGRSGRPHAEEADYDTVESALLARKRIVADVARMPERLSVASGTDVVLTGGCEEANDTEIAAYVDGQRQAGFNGRGAYALAVATRGLPPGVHALKVRCNFANGSTQAMGQTRLLVFDTSPVKLRPIADGAKLLQPVTLQVEFAPDFVCRTVQYYADGQALPNDAAFPQTAWWDARSRQPGVHALWVVATDADGFAFRSEAVEVTIPTRVRAEMPATPVCITPTAHTLHLNAVIAEGLAPIQVRYLIDGVPVAVRRQAPFAIAECDASLLPPGAHTVVVELRDSSEAIYTSEETPFEIQNALWTTPRPQPKQKQRSKPRTLPY